MLYFAYGSNMDWDQMKSRCPSSRFVGLAVLRDHRLAFTRYSKNRKCGVADAVPDEGKMVWGVVYEIDDRGVGPLDAAEGYRPGRHKNAYVRKECHVFVWGDENQPLAAAVYFGEPQDAPPPPNQQYKPNKQYKKLILDGARRWSLPDDYIKQIEAIEVAPD